MADSPQFTNYQINSATLGIMKEAAGNYMPDYGNWRMRFAESDIPEREEKEEKKDGHYLDPEANVNVDITEGDPGSGHWEDREWEETDKLDTYSKVWGDNPELADEYGSQEEFEQAAEEWWQDEASAAGMSVDEFKKTYEQTSRGSERVWVQDTEPTQGSYTITADASAGDVAVHDEESGVFPKRSPYKQANEPNVPQAVGPGGFKPRDPFSIDRLRAARKIQTDRQSLSSTHIHDQGTEVIRDLKNNLWNVGEDDKTKKKNRNRAHVIMQQLSHGAQNLLGPKGSIADFA